MQEFLLISVTMVVLALAGSLGASGVPCPGAACALATISTATQP